MVHHQRASGFNQEKQQDERQRPTPQGMDARTDEHGNAVLRNDLSMDSADLGGIDFVDASANCEYIMLLGCQYVC